MIEPVPPAALGLHPKCAALLQGLPLTVDFAALPSRNSLDEREGRHVLCDHGTRGDHGEVSEPRAAQDRCIRTDGRSLTDNRLGNPESPFIPLAHDWQPRTAGPTVIRKDRVGANEGVIRDRDALPQGNAILDGHSISDHDATFNEDMFADVTFFSDDRTGHDVAERPNACSGADLVAFNERQRV